MNDVVKLNANVTRLRDDLSRAVEIAKAAQAMLGGAAGNGVGTAALSAQIVDQCLELSFVADRPLDGVVVERCPEQVAQQHIAHTPIVQVRSWHPVVMQK